MGKEKKYHNDKLIFELIYCKGKKHGKGKEYFNDNYIFEGIYLNGKKKKRN